MESWWKTWPEVNLASKGKKLVLYGRSEDWLPKTLRRLRGRPDYIVDRNPVYSGTNYSGIPIKLPDRLFRENKDDVYIIITAGEYEGIITILKKNGFETGKHFCCCPEYYDYHLLEVIRSYKQELIISCSDYNDKTKVRYSRAGGGIYRYYIGPNQAEKIVTGSFRQLVQMGDQIFGVEYVDCKLYLFDREFQTLETWPLDFANYCGIAYDHKRDIVILVNAGQDTISIFDAQNMGLIERINFSDKSNQGETSRHHLNDACIFEDYLYISYFSYSGNWKIGNYDGGISEYHLDRLEKPPIVVVNDLWKPHSPEILEGDLCYLDSMRGRLYTTNQTIAGEFPGFVRGLAHDGRFYYIGQSEDMYISRRFGTMNSIMLNAGFYLFDKHTKASRFYPLLDNMNVHDLLILE